MKLANMCPTSEIVGVFRRRCFGDVFRDLRGHGLPLDGNGQPASRRSAASYREAVDAVGAIVLAVPTWRCRRLDR